LLIGALTHLCLTRHGEALRAWNADLVVPAPLHWLRRVWRGGNSSDAIAEVLGRQLGVPSPSFALKRKYYTRPQAGLPQRERRTNVRGAFQASKRCDFHGARVLLVDDILTTGTTAHECALALRAADARTVSVVTFARAL
jgi:ComF family protein